MASRLDEILHALAIGEIGIDEACRKVASAVRADQSGTRMWGILIESRITQQQISATVGRALLDAMENFEPEKTMWLAPGASADNASRKAVTNGDVLRTPATSKPQPAPEAAPVLQNAEQLRAFLWDQPGKRDGDANTPPPYAVEWMDSPVRAAPPRPKPGVTPVLPELPLGTIVKGRYRLDAHLGYGGIGQVFSATDLELERAGSATPHVTIKVVAVDLKREPQALVSLQNAVARTKSLRHPNIVATYGIENDAERLFVIMEPLSGRWLGDRIRQVRGTGVNHDAAWPIVSGIAAGLAFAHERNVVHSDLSPYAVFVTDDGVPKVMGFGLIHALPTSNEAMDLLDTMTLRAYSEAYTSDTWATHATPHPADDLYPLGVIAYELITGKHPFNRHSLTVARQKQLVYPPIPNLSRRAAKLIARCLSFERKQWPMDASRFIASLRGPMLLRLLFRGG